MPMEDDLKYLAAEAFELHLTINPRAGYHDTVEDFIKEHDEDDWLSPEDRDRAMETGRFVSGQVYANGSVSFYLVYGTDLAAVVAACARLCKEDRDRWTKSQGSPAQGPKGR